MPELMTVAEVAAYLRVNGKTVYRLLKSGKIPATRVGHQWRFDKSSIERWLQKSTAKAKILVIDDEPIIRLLFKETLEGLGHQVATADTGARGLQLVKEQDFDLVFLDLIMPEMNGAEVFRRIKAIKPGLPVTIITGHPEGDLMARALAEGPFGVMNKPFSVSDIATAVQTFLGVTHTHKEE